MGKIDYSKQTAIVTGASSGLGVEFASQLAARGSNLVLVARRVDRLEAVAKKLNKEHGVSVTVIARDLGAPDAGRTLHEELEGRGTRVTSLVNNAGFGTHGKFEDEDPDQLQAMLTLNINALVDLSRAYFSDLKSGNGVLINVASLLGYQPTPYLSAYGATKAFVLSFTESLWEEARGSDLGVLAICPGAMDTEFFEIAGASADYGTKRATPRDVVALALKTLDRRSAPPSIISNGRPLALVSKFLPRRQTVRIMGAMQRRQIDR